MPATPDVDRSSGRTIVILAVLHVVFFVASLVVMPMLAPGVKIPNPFAQDNAARELYATFGLAVRLSSFLQLLSALCLAALAAMWSEQEQRATTWALIGVGGAGSAILLSVSALVSWALAAPGGADLGPALHTLQFVPFLMGGPGWSAFFGLFLIGICRAGSAVLSRWLIWSGIILGIIGELATLVLLTIAASVALPITRFLGFLWLISAAVSWARKHKRERVGFVG